MDEGSEGAVEGMDVDAGGGNRPAGPSVVPGPLFTAVPAPTGEWPEVPTWLLDANPDFERMSVSDFVNAIFPWGKCDHGKRSFLQQIGNKSFADVLTLILHDMSILQLVLHTMEPVEATVSRSEDAKRGLRIYKRNVYAAIRHVAIKHWDALPDEEHTRIMILLGMRPTR